MSLNSIQDSSQASSTPDGSVDVNIDSLSDSDEGLSVGEEPRVKDVENSMQIKACRERIRRQQMQNLLMELQNVVFRTPSTKPVSKVSVLSQANQYLRCLRVLSAHLHEEKRWLKRRRAALELCLQASRLGKQPPPWPQVEPQPAPLPIAVREVCDLSDSTVPPIREATDDLVNGGSVPTSLSALPAKSKKNGSSTTSKQQHGKKKLSSESGAEKTSKHKSKAPPPQKVPDKATKTTAPTKLEAVTCEEGDMETTTGSDDSAAITYRLNDGHIGALRSIPTPTDTPRKYTLYPAKGTVLGDLSKVAAAAQHIIGPCVIKRVKLRSGQTVFIYRQPSQGVTPTADDAPTPGGATAAQDSPSGGAGDKDQPLSSGALAALNDAEVSTLQLAEPSSLPEPVLPPSPNDEMPDVGCADDSQGSSLQGVGGQDQVSHEDNMDDNEGDLGDTSEWISGDGDTCIVMKLPVSSDEEESSSDES